MNCKFCNAEVGEEYEVCPICGKALTAEEPAVQEIADAAEEAIIEETVYEEPVAAGEPVAAEEPVVEELIAAEEAVVAEEPAQKPKKKVWPLVLAIAGAVVALGVLAVVLLYAMGVDLKPRPNDILNKEVYTVEDDKAERKANAVVATIGDKKLTNAQLQIYYNMQVIEFVNYYGSYLSYIGMDYTQPLSEQTCAIDETLTWEQYFVDVAIQTWQNYQVMALLAEEAGFTLGEEWEAEFALLPETMEEQAVESGYENADAMVKELLGAICTMDDYMEYIQLASLSNEFYASEYERLTPTTEEIETYFAENEASFTENGITKESGLVSDVRHILVLFEGGTTDEEGNTTYSEDEKAAAYAEAEKILNEWKSGEATEDTFAELANTYSEDPGSNTTGGLYEDIAPGSSYYENFLKWSIDMSRQIGDTGIVESQSGYHIMYYVSGEAQWIISARTNLLAERTTALIDEAEQKWPIEITYRKIALAELSLS